MTHEAKHEQHYRGVLCGYCRQPIPVPSIVEKIATGEKESSERAARTFDLRCRACEREMRYRMSDIVEFEGSPRPRSLRMRAPLMSLDAKIARAAHG